MARCVLDALGCAAPLAEVTPPEPGALTAWSVSPPVPWREGDPYPPPPAAGWIPYDGSPAVRETSWWQACWLDRGGVMPLGRPEAGNGVGAYAETVLSTDSARDAVLSIGGSPPLAVWVNGALVWDNRLPHGYHPDADRVCVMLRAGENRLRVFSTWLFHVAIG